MYIAEEFGSSVWIIRKSTRIKEIEECTKVEKKQSQIIRVGSFEDTFNFVDNNGVRRGYGYELMQALAGYTGWKFEYVKCDWSNCFDKLENGEIDCFVSLEESIWSEQGISSVTTIGKSGIYFAINENPNPPAMLGRME